MNINSKLGRKKRFPVREATNLKGVDGMRMARYGMYTRFQHFQVQRQGKTDMKKLQRARV